MKMEDVQFPMRIKINNMAEFRQIIDKVMKAMEELENFEFDAKIVAESNDNKNDD